MSVIVKFTGDESDLADAIRAALERRFHLSVHQGSVDVTIHCQGGTFAVTFAQSKPIAIAMGSTPSSGEPRNVTSEVADVVKMVTGDQALKFIIGSHGTNPDKVTFRYLLDDKEQFLSSSSLKLEDFSAFVVDEAAKAHVKTVRIGIDSGTPGERRNTLSQAIRPQLSAAGIVVKLIEVQ
jgi:hypothetical protein